MCDLSDGSWYDREDTPRIGFHGIHLDDIVVAETALRRHKRPDGHAEIKFHLCSVVILARAPEVVDCESDEEEDYDG